MRCNLFPLCNIISTIRQDIYISYKDIKIIYHIKIHQDICVSILRSLIQVVERRKQIEIEEQEIRRKEKELMSTVKLPAEAESYKVQTIAEGKR